MKTIIEKYLLHLFSVYRIKCFWEIYKQECCLEIFCTNCFQCRELIYPKTVLIYPKNVLYFGFDAIEKQSIINFSRYRVMSQQLLVIPRSPFFIHLYTVFCLYTVSQNRRSTSSNFPVFHISGGISSWQAAFHLLILSVLWWVLL